MKPRVRTEAFHTAKARGSVRLLYASDLHLGLPWTRRCSAELIGLASATAPDLVLLGGDLVDNRFGLDAIEECVRALARGRPVAAVPGNHDVATGIADVRRRVLNAGGRWLPDEPARIATRDGAAVFVCGGALESADGEAVSVACLHDPASVDSACRAGFDLAFAGHLHGGQCVLFERDGRLYPGAWFNRWTGLRFQVGALSLFVCLGLGDTLPLRLNCPREVVVCDIAASGKV
jgi:predicted MPP superfamily phosphohydrolase